MGMRREIEHEIRGRDGLQKACDWVAYMASKGLKAGPVVVRLGRPRRNLEQNARFHAICTDVAEQAEWMGRKLTKDQWKVLFISGHAIATGGKADVVPGLEGEFVNVRESTAEMSKERISSLIDYVQAWCAENGVELTDGAQSGAKG